MMTTDQAHLHARQRGSGVSAHAAVGRRTQRAPPVAQQHHARMQRAAEVSRPRHVQLVHHRCSRAAAAPSHHRQGSHTGNLDHLGRGGADSAAPSLGCTTQAEFLHAWDACLSWPAAPIWSRAPGVRGARSCASSAASSMACGCSAGMCMSASRARCRVGRLVHTCSTCSDAASCNQHVTDARSRHRARPDAVRGSCTLATAAKLCWSRSGQPQTGSCGRPGAA